MHLDLHPLNILIGANGAGKSNLISFFKMLNEMMAGRFQQYIGTSGRAQSLLHFGPKITPQIEAKLEFEVENGVDTYHMRLFHAAGDTLIFAEETLSFLETGRAYPRIDELGAGHQETQIIKAAEEGKQTAKTLRYLLNRCRVYHFHDTSSTAGVRQSCYVGDNRWLMPDASNLAALLLKLREDNRGAAYQRIIGTIRLIAPFLMILFLSQIHLIVSFSTGKKGIQIGYLDHINFQTGLCVPFVLQRYSCSEKMNFQNLLLLMSLNWVFTPMP
jgi:predicted ATPase